jgi:hypothetical protein
VLFSRPAGSDREIETETTARTPIVNPYGTGRSIGEINYLGYPFDSADHNI